MPSQYRNRLPNGVGRSNDYGRAKPSLFYIQLLTVGRGILDLTGLDVRNKH